ncbi:hypothetical protein KAR91_07545 [Candidatus Pacearchaeota archaeon]|nr:hypothetical protein [Candidatus Pacearchaeota archaeon]
MSEYFDDDYNGIETTFHQYASTIIAVKSKYLKTVFRERIDELEKEHQRLVDVGLPTLKRDFIRDMIDELKDIYKKIFGKEYKSEEQ